jgi:hypothetical protein
MIRRVKLSICPKEVEGFSGLAQHGGPPGWKEESDPVGCDFVRGGRSMLPALTDHSTPLGPVCG